MIRPERDPHWCLGVEHGRDGLEPYTFADGENQRRYLQGVAYGKVQRAALLAASPYQSRVGIGFDLQQQGPRQSWKP
jgi:hypothetical protein